MPYHLKKSESIPHGIKRISTEQIDDAVEQLAHGEDRAEAVHEARKDIKKIRGVLRLMKPELQATYSLENARLRNVGRGLSEIRDAAAMIEVFDSLIEKHKADFPGIRRGLEKSKHETEQSIDVATAASEAIAGLHAIRRRAEDWPLRTNGFRALAPGLEASYRRGTKALRRAGKTGTPELFHEFRKCVKEHWYHLRLLEGLWTEPVEGREKSLKELETWLGDDHNLIVLQEKLSKEPDKYGAPEEVGLFLALAAREQQELRANALVLGQRLYEEKPRLFVRSLAKLWDAWQEQPHNLKRVQKKQAGKAPAKAKIAVA
jgi:CHAD domain-containing protein